MIKYITVVLVEENLAIKLCLHNPDYLFDSFIPHGRLTLKQFEEYSK